MTAFRPRPTPGYEGFPGWFYGPQGQSKLFQKADDVPAGWQDHPDKVGDDQRVSHTPVALLTPVQAAVKAGRVPSDKAAKIAPPAPTGPVALTREQVIAVLQEADVPFKPTDSLAALYKLLEAAAAAA